MNLLTVRLLLVSIIGIQLGTGITLNKRIIGGEEAPPHKFRWAVSIKGNVEALKAVGSCGASILNTEGNVYWLLTAAHCFYPTDGQSLYNLSNPENWHARVGLTKVDFTYKKHGFGFKFKERMKILFDKSYEKFFGTKKFKVPINDLHFSKIIIHPKYKPLLGQNDDSNIRMDNDIALMKLKNSLPIEQLPGVSTIDLPLSDIKTEWPPIGADCTIVGWGCTAPKKAANPIAKLAIMKIWNNTNCQSSMTSQLYLNPFSDFCAGYLKKSYGLCQGDSGSGLICDHQGVPTIAGVVSRGHGSDPGEYPAAFTRVSVFVDWIYEVIQAN